MAQMMLTKDNKVNLPKLYATEDIPLEDKRVIIKYFCPWGSWSWYAIEGEERDGDFLFWGLVDGHEKEWGYFTLSDLASVKGPYGLRIERDYHFGMPTVKEARIG